MARHAILQAFYTSDVWQLFRLGLIAKRGNGCQRCGRIIARSVDIIGHHKVELTPENVHDHAISLNPDLVELVCSDCHNLEHKRFGYQHMKEVFLVYGPPLSNMLEVVRQQMSRGDLIVNMDMLYSAISGLPEYDKPDALFSNVIGVQNFLIDNIKTRLGKWGTAWIVGGFPEKFKRERMAEDTGAELIFCPVSREDCLARLESSEALRYRKDEWRGYIEKWFEQYRE
ncbi:HNH endonuclease signature motif containing protein [Paenibacillus sp. FSL H7-0735]|uniref:HNH endonuclease signature motif containing protein n=1 Tax=Paenibacillus sp. FSL H7-0735 TaxID=2954736 RepID=UPI0030F7EA78